MNVSPPSFVNIMKIIIKKEKRGIMQLLLKSEINHWIFLVVCIPLLYAAITDWAKMIIPIWVSPLIVALSIIALSVSMDHFTLWVRILSAILAFVIFFCFQRMGVSSGGDTLLMTALGWALGLTGFLMLCMICSIAFLFVSAVYHRIWLHNKKWTLANSGRFQNTPFAPAVFVSFMILWIIYTLI